MSVRKCPDNKEINPYTKRCVIKCPENKVRTQNDEKKSFTCIQTKTKKLKLKLPIHINEPSVDVDKWYFQTNPFTQSYTSLEQKSLDSNPTNPCLEKEHLLEEKRELTKKISDKNKECEELKHIAIQQYFKKSEEKTSCKDLLSALQKLYINHKREDSDFILYFDSFINMFARDTMVTLKFKRQHVFEAICKLLLVFNYDNGELGKNKRFYSSLEKLIENPELPPLTRPQILSSNVNESSKGGIVDILFESEFSESLSNCNDGWQCDCNPIIMNEPINKKQYILIQNKYYEFEKAGDKYDITKMYTLANKSSQLNENINNRIVLMVNDVDSLDSKLVRAKNSNTDLIYKIYGVKSMNENTSLEIWFRRLLNDLYKTQTINDFLDYRNSVKDEKTVLSARFHQMIFTRSTMQYNTEHDYKLFIWGAVPRSGKSYMIGDFISNSQYRNVSERNNSIVLILGAKSETECQFVKMFCNNSNYDNYGIIVASSDIEKSCGGLKCKKNKLKDENDNEYTKFIYIFSQEWLKSNKMVSVINDKYKNITKLDMPKLKTYLKENKYVENPEIDFYKKNSKIELTKIELIKRFLPKPTKKVLDESTVFIPDLFKKPLFKKLFSNGNKIDLFFDEIHKGGSTDNTENILHAFHNANVHINLFVMVTATFAKPLQIYNTSFIDVAKKGVKLIEWSYEDQQRMKQVTNSIKQSQMINSRDGIERIVIKSVFDTYKEQYGKDKYLTVISKEYEKHPELVLIQPEQINSENIDIRNVFSENLKCNACKEIQYLHELQDPVNIFEDLDSVTDLIRFIGNRTEQNGIKSLDTKCVYHYLNTIGAPISSSHSELWFLPDKFLYPNEGNECRKLCKPVNHEDNMDETDETNTGLPNIEPLTRGLALLLMLNDFFKSRYNVLIVHNTSIYYKASTTSKKFTNTDIFGKETGPIFSAVNESNLSEYIKKIEKKTFSANKSLIILTGGKLRLGISLPCVDIAFNFDNIKSIDNNYQTMFRVLTERTNKPKKYGYYLDFNKDRAIQFLYEYNNTYNSGKKLATIKEKTESLQSLLILFNYNGLGLSKLDTSKELQLYNELIQTLELDQEPYQRFILGRTNMDNLIKKCLTNVNYTFLQELSKVLQKTKIQNRKKINKILVVGLPPASRGFNPVENEIRSTTDENDAMQLINTVVEILPSTIALLAIFANEYNCTNLKECILKSITNLEQLSEKMCSCDSNDVIINSSIFACFMNYDLNNEFYTKDKLQKILELLYDILEQPGSEQLLINSNFIFDNIKEVMGKPNNILIVTMTPEDIQTKITEYLPIREDEKNKYGEVFTPIILINEMADQFPKSIWSKPDLKWLDPANGIGNFPMVVYKRLMDGLKSWEPSPSKRSNHILKNMIYMVEINPKNVKISRKIFGPNANICCADFLLQEDKWKREFGVDAFDIIIGNPPFQPEKTEKDKKQGGHGNKILWDKFILSSLELVKPGGFLGFINPPPWRKPEHELYQIMTKDNQLLYLHIFNKKQTEQHFHITQRVDLYIIEKTPKYKNTIIIDELEIENNLNLSDWVFLPNYNYNNIKKILTSKENGIDIIYDTNYHTQNTDRMSKTKHGLFKYQVVHSITQNGPVCWWSNDNKLGHFDIKKVLLNLNEQQYPINDFKGEYGMSHLTFGIPITSKKQGDAIVSAINTDEFKEIIKATKWGIFQTEYKMFRYFKPDFYKQFSSNPQTKKRKMRARGGGTRKNNNA